VTPPVGSTARTALEERARQIRRKRPADAPPADPRATNTDTPEVEVITGTKRQADTSVADIDPQSGDGADVAALVIAHSAEDNDELTAEKVGCQSGGTRVFAAPVEVGVLLATGVEGCSVPRHATRPQRHGLQQRIFGNRIPREELEWKEIGSGMWDR
jgi:hypothetical protein